MLAEPAWTRDGLLGFPLDVCVIVNPQAIL